MLIRSLLLVAVAMCACNDNEPTAPLSPVGGGSHQVDPDIPDSGGNVDEEDAGINPDAGTEGPAPGECVRIASLRYTSDEIPTVTATSLPEDFLVTRQAATWRDDCEWLVIELSNGVCPAGAGHELEIMFSREAIEDGQIGLGLNPLEEEPMAVPGYRVRYTRPTRYAPEGLFGSCTGSSGQISFYDAPDVTRANDLRAVYDFRLTPCDDTRNPTLEVKGTFQVRLRRAAAAACPASP